MTSFYLVRHAHAEWSPGEGRSLSPQGLLAARWVAEILASVPIEGIYSSPACRARETVEPLAEQLGLSIHVEPDLRERELGGPVASFEQAVEATWRDPGLAFPGGESNAVAQQRGVAVVLCLLQQCPGGRLVLATHGNLLALLLQHFDSTIGFPFWRSLSMPDVYRLSLSDPDNAAIERLWQA